MSRIHLLLSIAIACAMAVAPPPRASAAPLQLPASFRRSETLDCDWSHTITLNADGTYQEKIVTHGRQMVGAAGRWQYRDGSTAVVLLDEYGDEEKLRIIGDDSLQDLGARHCAPLARLPHVVPIAPQMPAVTLGSDVWVLEEVGSSTVVGRPPVMAFNMHDGTINGFDGCGDFAATFVRHVMATEPVEESTISIHPMRQHICDGKTAAVQRAFLSALSQASGYHLCCSTLRLRRGGADIATFRTDRS